MQDDSHHQDDIVFLVGDLDLNFHLPQESWEGRQPKENSFELFFHGPQWLSVKLFEKTVKVNPWPLKSNIDTKNDHILKGTTFSKPSFWVFLNLNACN